MVVNQKISDKEKKAAVINKSQQVTDVFSDNKPAGSVINRDCDYDRKGHDVDHIIAVDHNALRIGYIPVPGWGRHGIAYGPFDHMPGLFFSAFILNGHNGSQTCIYWSSKVRRISRGVIRKLLHWLPSSIWPKKLLSSINPEKPHDYNWPHIQDNIAIGFFNNAIPSRPKRQGNAFLVRADNINNAKLMLSGPSGMMPVIESLQNLPIYYIIGMRSNSVVYYVSTMHGAKSNAPYPMMRPVGLNPLASHNKLYAAIYQSILGEIGFRVDTRVYGIKVKQLKEWDHWYAGAQFADKLTGKGSLDQRIHDHGPNWNIIKGQFERTVKGLSIRGIDNLAAVFLPEPSGLIHVQFEIPAGIHQIGFILRMKDEYNYWCLRLHKNDAELLLTRRGETELKARGKIILKNKHMNSLLILDNEYGLAAFINGKTIFGGEILQTEFNNATGVGLLASNAGKNMYLRDLEAHPRVLPMPAGLDLGAPWDPSSGPEIIKDDFHGNEQELDGRILGRDQIVWRKEIGEGTFLLTGNNALKVKGDVQKPNPGRTAYTVDWKAHEFAVLESIIVPPGTGQGQGEKGRAGFVFWQDIDNYIIINTYLDDWKVGKSISSFFVINGSEDIYRAVWTNVGKRILWGKPYKLRTAFDGLRYLVHLNDEPVLYRSLTDVYPDVRRLRINRVGLAANWEFGDDTGSKFHYFKACGPQCGD